MGTPAVKWMEAEKSQLVGPVIFVFAVTVALVPILLLDLEGGATEQVIFILLNVVLISYIVWEVMRLYRHSRRMAFVQPPVIASLMLFGKDYILPNIPTLFGEENPVALLFAVWRGDYMYWLNMSLFGVGLAVFGMWRGYHSRLGMWLAMRVQRFMIRRNLVASSFDPNMQAVLILFLLSVIGVIVQIRLGTFGYSADIEKLQQAQDVQAWVGLLTQAGSLAFLVLCLAVFSRGRRTSAAIWMLFLTVLLWQFAVGFLSGFKSQVVMPVIIVGVAYYMARGRLSFGLIVLSVVMLFAAFQTIEPFRKARWADRNFDGTSIISIASTFWTAATNPADYIVQKDETTFAEVAARTDLITFTTVSLNYGHNSELNEFAPRFLLDLALIPVNAFVPRFLWSGKSLVNDGWWFDAYVLGHGPSTRSSTAMGPVAYFYFGGGFLLILAGFFAIGMLQRVAFSAFIPLGLGGWLIFLGTLPTLALMPSNVSAALAGLLRMLPFLILAQLWVIRKR
tara:strand:- start:1667 stop:3190 length:1524 start_codon:yes stop_codon:yes gene_type:complete